MVMLDGKFIGQWCRPLRSFVKVLARIHKDKFSSKDSKLETRLIYCPGSIGRHLISLEMKLVLYTRIQSSDFASLVAYYH